MGVPSRPFAGAARGRGDRGAVEPAGGVAALVNDGTPAGGPLEGYGDLLGQLKAEIRSARTRAVQAANSELIGLYWRMGRLILLRREDEGWGTRVVQRLSLDLRAEFPEARGFGPGNLDYMRRMAAAWPEEVSLRLVGRLGWGHVQTLLDKLDTAQLRDW